MARQRGYLAREMGKEQEEATLNVVIDGFERNKRMSLE
jgi:hypothetical protein